MEDWKPYALAVASAAVAWTLGLFSSWWSVRNQRQRSKRRVLFYLLELENLIARMVVEEEIDYLLKILREKLSQSLSAHAENAIRQKVRPFLVRSIVEYRSAQIVELGSGYQNAVEELSYIKPFRAFRLKGHTRLVDRFEMVHKLLEKVPTLDPAVTTEQLGVLDEFVQSLSPEVIREDLAVVRSELVSLSCSIGPATWLKAKRRVKRSASLTADDKKAIEKYIDQMRGFMMKKLLENLAHLSSATS